MLSYNHSMGECDLLPERVAASAEEIGLRRDALILVGLSGGPDSTALLDAFRRLGYSVAAAHYHHGLRAEADADARAAENLARRLGVPFVLGKAEDEGTPIPKTGTEEAARERRYRFLFSAARQLGARAVAVGHTYDDRAETVLMHIIRGTGIHGLAALRPRAILPRWDENIPLVRPLLGVRRAETIAYCACRGLPVRWDWTNWQRKYLRNRVRLDLLPRLSSENPAIAKALWRLGEVAAAEDELLENLARRVLEKTAVQQGKGYIGLRRSALLAEPLALQRRTLKLAARLLGAEEVPFSAIADALRAARSTSGRARPWYAGVFLLAEDDVLWLTRSPEALPAEAFPQMPAERPIPLRFGSKVELANGWEFRLGEPVPLPQNWREQSAPHSVWLDADAFVQPLILRPPRVGDRIAPLGMGGRSQKIGDVFTNAKIPLRARGRWPLLCAGGEVVWLPMLRISETARIRPATRLAVKVSVLKRE